MPLPVRRDPPGGGQGRPVKAGRAGGQPSTYKADIGRSSGGVGSGKAPGEGGGTYTGRTAPLTKSPVLSRSVAGLKGTGVPTAAAAVYGRPAQPGSPLTARTAGGGAPHKAAGTSRGSGPRTGGGTGQGVSKGTGQGVSKGIGSGGQGPGGHSTSKAAGPSPNVHDMGNGASATQMVIDGEAFNLAKVKELLPELKQQLKQKDTMLERCESELSLTRQALRARDVDVEKLKAEVHKLKSVLQATVHKDQPDILATIHEEATMAGQEVRLKKQGVSGESSAAGIGPAAIIHHEKDFR